MVKVKKAYTIAESQLIVNKAKEILFATWSNCQATYPNFCLDIMGSDVTYARLKELSDIFETKEINIGTDVEHGYYDSVTSFTTLTFYNPKI